MYGFRRPVALQKYIEGNRRSLAQVLTPQHLITLGDEVIGSIGAAGTPGAKLDDSCAHAGLDRIRDRLKWHRGH